MCWDTMDLFLSKNMIVLGHNVFTYFSLEITFFPESSDSEHKMLIACNSEFWVCSLETIKMLLKH